MSEEMNIEKARDIIAQYEWALETSNADRTVLDVQNAKGYLDRDCQLRPLIEELVGALDKILLTGQIHNESECCLCAINARNRSKDALSKAESKGFKGENNE